MRTAEMEQRLGPFPPEAQTPRHSAHTTELPWMGNPTLHGFSAHLSCSPCSFPGLPWKHFLNKVLSLGFSDQGLLLEVLSSQSVLPKREQRHGKGESQCKISQLCAGSGA